MKVLAVSHVPHEGMGSFESVLNARRAQIEKIVSYEQDIRDLDEERHDLAIILGGPMGVYQSDIFPFLSAEMAYIERRLKKGLPLLGICLGSQLMAQVLGSDVHPGRQGKEIGWQPLTLTEKGKNNPVRHLAGDRTMMMHWHGDTYKLPDGATLLASSEKYEVQAYEWGEAALGLQCHPEVTPNSLEFWIVSSGFKEIEDSGQTVPGFREETARHAETLRQQAALFLGEWLDKVMKERQQAA